MSFTAPISSRHTTILNGLYSMFKARKYKPVQVYSHSTPSRSNPNLSKYKQVNNSFQLTTICNIMSKPAIVAGFLCFFRTFFTVSNYIFHFTPHKIVLCISNPRYCSRYQVGQVGSFLWFPMSSTEIIRKIIRQDSISRKSRPPCGRIIIMPNNQTIDYQSIKTLACRWLYT